MFCHVSTAYCHLHERHLKEKAYAPPADPYKIIKAVEWMDEEVVDSMTDKYDNISHYTKLCIHLLI